jgi:TRAP-type C4-dicarboxylate transport system permease small subunit
MGATALFMIKFGIELVRVTMGQTIGEFPWLSVGVTYMPIPLGGFLVLLFIIEKLWVGEAPADSIMFRDQPLTE